MLIMHVEQVTFEESKEADTSSKQATHNVSRGLYNKVLTICFLLANAI